MISQNLQDLQKIKLKFKKTIDTKKKLIDKLKNYKVADNLPNLEFKKSKLIDNFLKYQSNFLVKDLTVQCKSELTILEIEALKDTEFKEHVHIYQSQTIYIKEGSILNLTNNAPFEKLYVKGESFFTSKKSPHRIKYLKGTKVLIVFLPNLEII